MGQKFDLGQKYMSLEIKHKPYGAPESYEELYRDYWSYVEAILVKAGIRPENRLDEAMNIFVKMFEKDILNWYDPDKLWRIGTVNGKKVTLRDGQEEPEGFVLEGRRTAPFMSILRSYVMLSARGARDRQMSRDAREFPIGEEVVTTQVVCPEDEWVESLDSQRLWKNAKENLRQRDEQLAKVLDRMIQLIEENDGVLPRNHRKVLAKEFKVADDVMSKMLSQVRDRLAESGLSPQARAA